MQPLVKPRPTPRLPSPRPTRSRPPLARRRQIVHRDVKLHNVMLAHKGHFGSVQLIDFNIAAKIGDTGHALHCGTLGYTPPEVAPAQHSRRSDDDKPRRFPGTNLQSGA